MIPDTHPTDHALEFFALALLILAVAVLWLAATHETPEEKQIRKLIQHRKARIKRIDAYLDPEKKGSHRPLSEGDTTHEKAKIARRWLPFFAILCGLCLPHGVSAQQPNCTIAWASYTQGTFPAVSLQVARSQNSGGPYSIKATLPASQTSWTDTDIATFNTRTWYYVTRGIDAYGNFSQWSAETACVTNNEQQTLPANPGGSPTTPPNPSATAH